MKFTLFVAEFTQDSWEREKDTVQSVLSKIHENCVQIGIGIWIVKTKETYPSIYHLTTLLRTWKVPFALVPIAELPPTVCVSPDVVQQLGKLGLDVYEISQK